MEDWKFIALLALSAIITVASIATLNTLLIAAGLITVLMIALLYRLWYVIEAVVFKHTRVVELFNGYELSGAREAATRKLNGAFSATAAALLTTSAKQGIELERLESIIQQTGAPFKFVLQVERLSAKKLLDAMQTKMSMKRLEISKLSTSSEKKNIARLDALKRETAELEREIATVSASTPMRLRHYIMTSALSENRFTAEERAISQIRELSNRFGAFLGAEPTLLSGSELTTVLELDSTLVE
jgi:hypothetical protein